MSTQNHWAAITVALVVAGAGGCRPPPAPPNQVIVHATNDEGRPVVGATLLAGGEPVAQTLTDGRARLDVRGDEGETFSVVVECPAGYRSPGAPLAIRRLGIQAAAAPEYTVTCRATRHVLVVAVRASGGPDLPLLYLGREIARTDADGAAHVALEMDARDRVELTLGTNEKGNETIHPRNPALVLEMPDHDDIQMLAVSFTHDAKTSPRRGPRPGPIPF